MKNIQGGTIAGNKVPEDRVTGNRCLTMAGGPHLLVKGILLYSNGQGVATMNWDQKNVTEVLRKLRKLLWGLCFICE